MMKGLPNKKLVLSAGVYPRRSTVLRWVGERFPGLAVTPPSLIMNHNVTTKEAALR